MQIDGRSADFMADHRRTMDVQRRKKTAPTSAESASWRMHPPETVSGQRSQDGGRRMAAEQIDGQVSSTWDHPQRMRQLPERGIGGSPSEPGRCGRELRPARRTP